MFIVYDRHKKEIELPDTVDVLIHLPMSKKLRNEGVFVAHAIQYNISAKGNSVEQALQRLEDLIVLHCEEALKMEIHPLNMAELHYMKAFFLGVPVSESSLKGNINVRLSRQLAKHLDIKEQAQFSIDVRSVCEIQQKIELKQKVELLSIEKLIEFAA